MLSLIDHLFQRAGNGVLTNAGQFCSRNEKLSVLSEFFFLTNGQQPVPFTTKHSDLRLSSFSISTTCNPLDLSKFTGPNYFARTQREEGEKGNFDFGGATKVFSPPWFGSDCAHSTAIFFCRVLNSRCYIYS